MSSHDAGLWGRRRVHAPGFAPLIPIVRHPVSVEYVFRATWGTYSPRSQGVFFRGDFVPPVRTGRKTSAIHFCLLVYLSTFVTITREFALFISGIFEYSGLTLNFGAYFGEF